MVHATEIPKITIYNESSKESGNTIAKNIAPFAMLVAHFLIKRLTCQRNTGESKGPLRLNLNSEKWYKQLDKEATL